MHTELKAARCSSSGTYHEGNETKDTYILVSGLEELAEGERHAGKLHERRPLVQHRPCRRRVSISARQPYADNGGLDALPQRQHEGGIRALVSSRQDCKEWHNLSPKRSGKCCNSAKRLRSVRHSCPRCGGETLNDVGADPGGAGQVHGLDARHHALGHRLALAQVRPECRVQWLWREQQVGNEEKDSGEKAKESSARKTQRKEAGRTIVSDGSEGVGVSIEQDSPGAGAGQRVGGDGLRDLQGHFVHDAVQRHAQCCWDPPHRRGLLP